MESQRTKWTVARDQMPVTHNIWNDPKCLKYWAHLVSNNLTILYDFYDHPSCSGSIWWTWFQVNDKARTDEHLYFAKRFIVNKCAPSTIPDNLRASQILRYDGRDCAKLG
jgi:hypothetical protein